MSPGSFGFSMLHVCKLSRQLDGYPLGLGLVVEDKPTEFSCGVCDFCSKTQNLIGILEKIGDDCVKATGFFHSGPELHCNRLHPHPK